MTAALLQFVVIITYPAQDVDLNNQDFDQLLEVVAPEETQKLGILCSK